MSLTEPDTLAQVLRASADIDDCTQENIENIQRASSDFIDQENASLMTVVDRLRGESPAMA